MRGNRIDLVHHAVKVGSIPTHAGKPRQGPTFPSGSKVYPHSCGETRALLAFMRTRLGLSPLMRGNPPPYPVRPVLRGSIPTHAGKPVKKVAVAYRPRVYPHSCGETGRGLIQDRRDQGLSPLMRGNLHGNLYIFAIERSIPTHAGKPDISNSNSQTSWVYPHSCGETCSIVPIVVVVLGLSPLMRGNLVRAAQHLAAPGSIPTHAGKPIVASQVANRIRVYPHSCGETSS